MDSNGQYAVSGVSVKQTPQLSQGGTLTQTTIVSFSVGDHGPFTVVFPTASPAPADILAAITNQVDALKQLAGGLATLNQQNQLSK